MFLKTDQLYLRALEPADLTFLYTLENDVAVWPVSNTVAPFSQAVLEQYLEQASLDIYTTRQLRLIICTAAGEPAGAVDLFDFDPHHRRAGVGIVVREPFRRQGLATRALQLLLHYCTEHLLLHQVYCGIAADNAASLDLFQKAGFETCGRKKDWLRTPAGWQDVVDLQKVFFN